MTTKDFNESYIKANFGVDKKTFLEAIKLSPSSQGYIHGAISEILLKKLLEENGYKVLRIIEKPRGGFKAKRQDVRGDFYIQKKGDKLWYIVESKGLKSNAEFSHARRKILGSKKGTLRFLGKHIDPGHRKNKDRYKRALVNYQKARKKWEAKHKNKKYPSFNWNKNNPGACNCSLNKVFKSIKKLEGWIKKFSDSDFGESKYRNLTAPFLILETHTPSRRTAPITGINQAAPLINDFDIMAVDLFLRTKKHEFVFMNPKKMNHSPSSPEHIYQNYIIDILIKDRHEKPKILPPWYSNISECIKKTKPSLHKIDYSQVDKRSS